MAFFKNHNNQSLALTVSLPLIFCFLYSISTNTVVQAASNKRAATDSEFISHQPDNHLNLQEILETEQLTKDKHSRRECSFDPNHIDYRMRTDELIASEGYPEETHYVTTEDGYIFQVHRIPNPGKPAVYALHGLFSSSRDFLMNCKGRALAYKLYDAGYDVWLGNFRGNAYGINHTTLDTKSREFWEFSIDEIIAYDGPAAVSYILKETGQEKLTWVGHSLGNAILFGMLSYRTEYNDKINLGVSLGTSIFLGNTKSTVLKLTSMVQRIIESFVFTFWRGEVFPRNLFALYHFLVPRVCQRAAVMDRPGICAAFYFLLDGRDPAQFNNVYIPFAVGGVPSSTSARVAGQGLQWIATGKFTKYDFGTEKNINKYGSAEPPKYNLANVVAPILNFWADNDYVTSKADVLQAVTLLPNVIENVRVNWTNWNHIDYLYGKDADILVYDKILQVLEQRSPTTLETKVNTAKPLE